MVTAANADNIARQAFQGGDLGANTATLAPARSGDARTAAERPIALTLVRLLSGAATAAFPAPSSTRSPAPRAVVTVDNTVPDGMGGNVHYLLSVNDQTGAFTGTFVFTNFHGDGGGVINGPVSVSGQYAQGVGITEILFDFQSVRIVDGTEDVTAVRNGGPGFRGRRGGSATLDIVFVDNVSRKTLWLSNVTLVDTIGTGYHDTTLSGRIYLHDHGYVDMVTLVPFHYLTGNSYPSSGQFVVTGKDNKKVQLTVIDTTQYRLDVDTNGDGLMGSDRRSEHAGRNPLNSDRVRALAVERIRIEDRARVEPDGTPGRTLNSGPPPPGPSGTIRNRSVFIVFSLTRRSPDLW